MYKTIFVSVLILVCASQATDAQPVKISLAGGYKVVPNPSGTQFETALSYALAEKPTYWRSALVMTETQLVHGTNYRFTLRNDDGTLAQRVIYAPFEGLPPLNATVATIPGGWSESTEPASYQHVLDAIYKQYPQVRDYYLSGVESQVVAGFNYKVGFQKNVQNDDQYKYRVRYAYFTVFLDLKQVYHITLVERIDVYGYTVEEIAKFTSTFTGYNVATIQNIWPLSRDGLKFAIVKGAVKKLVYIFKSRGTQRLVIA